MISNDHLQRRESDRTHQEAAPHEHDLQEAFHQAQINLLRYQELFDFAPVGYLVTDAQGVIQEANHAAAAMLGTRKQFLTGLPLLFFVGENDRRAFASNLFHLVYDSPPQMQWMLQLCPHRAAPLHVHITVSASATRGEPRVLRWALRDVSKQRQAEDKFLAEREFSERLIELAEAAVLVLDPIGRIVRGNRYFHSLTGHEPGELKGCLLADLLFQDDRPSLERGLRGLLARDGNAQGTFRIQSRNHKTRTIAWSARPLTADPAQEAKMLLVGNDITALHEAQQRAVQVERLAAIGEMIAGLSHESRNALQRSQSCLVLLGYRLQGQPEALALLERVQKAHDDLHRLYEGVREYAAPIRLETEEASLTTLWREAWDDLALARVGRDAELREEIEVSDCLCEVSPVHVKGVFRNLLENALSAAFGPVSVVIRCTQTELKGRAAIRVQVRDNGPGFSPEGSQKAFEPFFTTKVHGSGLGLPICKRIVEAHGGHITLGEQNGTGAVVLVTLPRIVG